MRSKRMLLPFVTFLVLFLWIACSGAADREKEFQNTIKMNVPQLTAQAKTALEKKYPGEDWEKYKFPKFAYINDYVLLSYKIAVKEYKLLAKFPCYCFCETMGHKNLAYCFLKNGIPGEFDPHAAGCNTCDRQTMHAFVWNELGIPMDRMLKVMAEIYKR